MYSCDAAAMCFLVDTVTLERERESRARTIQPAVLFTLFFRCSQVVAWVQFSTYLTHQQHRRVGVWAWVVWRWSSSG